MPLDRNARTALRFLLGHLLVGVLAAFLFAGLLIATDAFSLEEGMVRFEAYRVAGEDALISHEVFEETKELKFHLTKGTAAKYKNDIDEIAAPECYFFRGPVSWTIRTYSKFLHLPATYSSQGSHFTQPGGTMSEGTTA